MSESSERVRPTMSGQHELQMSENLQLYDLHREDAIRDRHILYARSLIQRLDEGYTFEWVISTLVQEIPGKNLDVLSFIPLANHLLKDSGRDLQIDLSLNITTLGGDVIVASEDVVEDIEAGLANYLRNKQSADDAIHDMFAQMIAERLLGGIPVSVIMAIMKSDITAYEMDVKKISRALNAILEESGSTIKFDTYLEPIYVLGEAPDDQSME